MTKTPEAETLSDSEIEAGSLIIKFLQDNEGGATVKDIAKHLKKHRSTDDRDLDKLVQEVLENGAALGFLERKGFHYMNWEARKGSALSRRSNFRKRRRRQIGRRSSRQRKSTALD